MFRTLSQGVGFALSLVTLLGTVHGEIPLPEMCWPDCNAYLENQQCQAWFGSEWYYCGWANGWTYCCAGG
jgi:hypothetical protein